MKIRIPAVTIEIDPDEWTETFGVQGASEIREDVKRYVLNEMTSIGAFGSGEVTVKSVTINKR